MKRTTRMNRCARWWAERFKYNNTLLLEVRWTRSRTWGSNPHVYDHDRRDIVNVTGCGYCKASSVLAQCLAGLPGLTDTEVNAVSALAGSGVRFTLAKFSEACGDKYEIRSHYDGYRIEIYRVSRKGGE